MLLLAPSLYILKNRIKNAINQCRRRISWSNAFFWRKPFSLVEFWCGFAKKSLSKSELLFFESVLWLDEGNTDENDERLFIAAFILLEKEENLKKIFLAILLKFLGISRKFLWNFSAIFHWNFGYGKRIGKSACARSLNFGRIRTERH